MKRKQLYSPAGFDGRSPRDCGVVAVQHLLGISYTEAKALTFRYGFSSLSGTPLGMVERVLEAEGRDVVNLAVPRDTRLVTFAQMLSFELNYCIRVHKHIVPCIRGVLYNVNGTNDNVVLDCFCVR